MIIINLDPYISFDGTILNNNSFIYYNEIIHKESEGRASDIICHTNSSDPSRNSTGNWYFPNGQMVPSVASSIHMPTDSCNPSAFLTRWSHAEISLYRAGHLTQTGYYYCVATYAAIEETLYVYIGKEKECM